uniref:RAP2A, member of RAS oncogene family n=1 Tax=Athene cunicularia TaxID=194338 RepID=A0A663MMN6_ATHCN
MLKGGLDIFPVLTPRDCQHRKYYIPSFCSAEAFLADFLKVPVILVGNKVDLESEREVSSSEGRALAEEWGCPFMETSAKSKTMVDELFAEIVRQMNYAAQPDKDDPCCSACNIQ